MELYSLPNIVTKGKRRLGQGHGSGRVKTAGRGTKGQKARGKIPISFEGGGVPLVKRLPFLRGRGRNKAFAKKAIAINVDKLNVFKKNSVVDLESVIENKLVKAKDARKYGVKILGDGKVSLPLTVRLPISRNAALKIEKIGGKIENKL